MAAVSRHELSVNAGVVEAAVRRPYVEVGIDALGRCEVAALRLDLCLSISRRGFQGESVLLDVLFDTARDLLMYVDNESMKYSENKTHVQPTPVNSTERGAHSLFLLSLP